MQPQRPMRRRGGLGASCAGVACEHTLGRQPLHLYGYLWAKPELVADDKSGTFSFVVPDTVLFKQQKPIKWFFTSKQEKGKILVKSKKNLSVTHVLSAFLEPKHFSTNSANNPVTTSTTSSSSRTSTDDDESLVVATYTYVDRSSSGESVLVVEHLTRTALHQLLTTRDKPPLSVLPRFIPARSGYNHLVQAVFTPDSCCVIRKCVSSHLVSDTRLGVAERTATFEPDERQTQPRELTNRELCDQIERMHLEMSTHLQKIIGKPVARHVAYFKIGADDRVYLLWSSMLSFETGPLAFVKNLQLSLSHHDRLQHSVATARTIADKGSLPSSATSVASSHALHKTCPRCRRRMARHLVDFYATYKAVIKSHEEEPHDPLAQDGSCVPPLLGQILAPISDGRFKELSQDPVFLYRTIALCQACAKQINTTSAKKPKESPTVEATAANTVQRQPERIKPIYMQSAHSVFWGRVERQEHAARKRKIQTSVAVRPATTSASSRASTSAIGREKPTSKQSSEDLTRATFKRLLPLLASQAAAHSAQADEPKHCVQKLAEHLQRTYGGPSVRLALARACMYPPTSLVSLDMLQWVCEPKLLADVFTYWTEFCKVHDSKYSSSAMDVDALDAMLSVYTTSNDLAVRSRARAAHAQPIEGITSSTSTTAFIHTPSPLFRPERPRTAHPSHGGVSTMRNSRVLVHCAASSKSIQKPVPEKAIPLRPRPPPRNNQVESCAHDSFPRGQSRTIDDVECEVDVAATPLHNDDDTVGLVVRVRPTQQQQQQGGTDTLSPVMSLTLDMQQILAIVSRNSTHSSHIVPLTGDALVTMVLDALSLQRGCLSVLHASPEPALAHGDGLTADEPRLLHETLLQPSLSPTD